MENVKTYWDYKMPENLFGEQEDWNQVLMAKINEVVGGIFRNIETEKSITIDHKLLPLFDTLMFFDKENSTYMGAKVEVVNNLNDIIKIKIGDFIYELPVINFLN